MIGSLRFRLPALFLLGIVLAGVVAALISLRLFQTYTRSQSVQELQREASGLSQLYADAALRAADEGSDAIDFAASKLELATGDRIYYIGASLFPGQDSGLARLAESSVPGRGDGADGPRHVRVHAAGKQPLVPRRRRAGAARARERGARRDRRREAAHRAARPVAAARRSGSPPPSAVGALLAGLLSWWLSRKITGPVLALSSAADEIASGNYAVRVPAGGAGTRSAISRSGSTRWRLELAATEERERQFLMSVSHELRTPLTAIKGHVDAIRDGLFDDPELERASLDVVAGETIRLERLVGDVLDLAKLNAHRFTVHAQEVDIGVLVEQAHASFGEEARRREIDFRLDDDPAAPTIVTDGDRVLQVITNLLANAFRWTPDGGIVSLGSSTAGRPRPDRRARHRAGDPARRARAHLRAVHLAGQPRHRARASDRPRARARARRSHRARVDRRRGQPLPARAARAAGLTRPQRPSAR